jgi:methyl-accepting chemotaxis protein
MLLPKPLIFSPRFRFYQRENISEGTAVSTRLSITAKMSSAFLALLIIMASIGLFATIKIGAVNDLSMEMRSRWLPATQLIGDLHAYMWQFRVQQSNHIAAVTPAETEKAKKLMRNESNAISETLNDYKRFLGDKDQKYLFADLEKNWLEYQQTNEKLTGLPDNSSKLAFEIFNGEALDKFYNIEDNIIQINDLNMKGGSALTKKSEEIYANSLKMLTGTIIFGLIAAITLSGLLVQTVAKPIKGMSATVKRLIAGDLEVAVPGTNRSDELGSLARALESFKVLFAADQERARIDLERARETEETINVIGGGLAALAQGNLMYRVDGDTSGPLSKLNADYNGAVSHLFEVLTEIVEGYGTIKDGTDAIAQASSDLSERTELQADSLARTAKTLGNFTDSVRVAADNAQQTSARLGVARATAEKVDETAKRAVIAMRNIQASSKEMTDIISTIDGLAFQTNLLALNAGVEAARAGSAGAGFAIVANEVRRLAQRSAEAATSIRQLVATSGAMIVEGVSLVENSGEALRQIVSEVTEVSGLMDEIACATKKQASGISEISSTVASMDLATQQNYIMVEQSRASSCTLSDEVERLFDLFLFFDIGTKSPENLRYFDHAKNNLRILQ